MIATLSAAVNQVQFFSRSLGVATSDRCLADPSLTRCPGQVLVSRDGGARWKPVLSGCRTGVRHRERHRPALGGRAPSSVSAVSSPAPTAAPWHPPGHTNLGVLSPQVKVTLAASPSGLAWATVFDQLSCAMHGCTAADLLHSGNGGRTWSAAALADAYPDECAGDSIVFSAAPDGTALGGDRPERCRLLPAVRPGVPVRPVRMGRLGNCRRGS